MTDQTTGNGQRPPYNGASGRPYPTSFSMVFTYLLVTHG